MHTYEVDMKDKPSWEKSSYWTWPQNSPLICYKTTQQSVKIWLRGYGLGSYQNQDWHSSLGNVFCTILRSPLKSTLNTYIVQHPFVFLIEFLEAPLSESLGLNVQHKRQSPIASSNLAVTWVASTLSGFKGIWLNTERSICFLKGLIGCLQKTLHIIFLTPSYCEIGTISTGV